MQSGRPYIIVWLVIERHLGDHASADIHVCAIDRETKPVGQAWFALTLCRGRYSRGGGANVS